MGKSNTEQPVVATVADSGGTKGKSSTADGRSDGDRRTESGGTGRAGGTGRGRGNASTEKTGLPKLVAVEDGKPLTPPEPKKDEGVSKRTLQRRAAAEKKKQEEKGKGKATDLKVKSDNLQPHVAMILVVGFEYLAKPLGEHWKVTPEEAARVAEPLSNILAQYMKANEAMEKYADWIGVLTALAIIVVPRMMMHQAINADKKKKGGQLHANNSNNGGTLDAGTMRTNEGTGAGTKRPADNQPTTSSSDWTADVLAPLATY